MGWDGAYTAKVLPGTRVVPEDPAWGEHQERETRCGASSIGMLQLLNKIVFLVRFLELCFPHPQCPTSSTHPAKTP